ncbi:MAG: energy transducer TonB [Sulfurimonas sp.]
MKKTKSVKKVPPKKIVPKKVKKKKVTPPKVKPAIVIPIIKKEIEKPKEIEEEVLETKVIEQENIVELNTSSKSLNTKVNVADIQQKQYINDNLAKISLLLSDNLYYPRRARKRGIVGKVILKFNILQDGSVNAVKIISSNSEILSKAATKTIKNLSGKFPKPNQKLSIQIPIEYKLQ